MNLNKSISYTTIDNETMIHNSNLGKTLLLDAKGTEIWKLICQGLNENEIVKNLIQKYPKYEQDIVNDVHEFFELLNKYEVIDNK